MRKLSRGALAAIAIAVLVPSGIAVAKSVEHNRWHQMSPETRARLDEGKLAMAKTALKLNAEQEKLWAAVETDVRAASKARAEKIAEWEKMRAERDKNRADGKKPDVLERLEKMTQHMSEGAERMKSFTGAFKPFYVSLSDEQKDVLKPLMREFMPGMGRGRHGGGRWAHGGERDGGWGHHGGWGGHKRGEHGDRGGRGHRRQDDGGGGGEGGQTAPQTAPQNAPDSEGDGEMPVPSDKL